MNDRQDIEFQIEGDASDATRAIKSVSAEVTAFINNIAHAETRLRQLFTHQLPDQLKAMERHIKAVSGPLPANYGQVGRVARNFASGGPAAQLDNSLFSGVLANLRTDKALQALRYEREANKILEARRTIFERIRAVMPDGTSEATLARSYRQALQAVGDIPAEAGKTRQQWMSRTLAETRAFESQVRDIKVREAAKTAEAQQAIYDRYMKRSFKGLFGLNDPGERDRQAQSIIDRLETFGYRRGVNVDTARLQQLYDDEAATRAATAVSRPPPAPKPTRPAPQPVTRDQRAAEGIQAVHDRFSYNGGAGMFGVQARVLGNYAAMGAILSSLTYAGTSAVKFEAQLKDVQAISASTEIEMKALEKTILSVGSSTKFSVQEIADGTKILAQAGYSVAQIQQVIQPIADLAAGAGASFTDAANITTSILSIFDMSIDRTTEVTNTLTAGLNKSKLGLDQLSLGIQYAGNIAADGGVQFEEMVAAMGAMANAGIKSGSTLGTGFRALITELENPSKKFQENLAKVGLTVADVDVKTQGLGQVMQTLSDHSFDSAAAMGSFELRAAAAYSALSNNLNVFQDLQTEIIGTTAAQTAAATQMDTFQAQWQRLANAVTEFTTIVGGPTLAALQGMIGGLASLLHAATVLAPAIQLVGSLLLSWGIVSLLKWVGQLTLGMLVQTSVLSGWNGAATMGALRTGQLGVAFVGLTNGIRASTLAWLASPIGWFTIALTALTVGLSAFSQIQGQANRRIEEHAAAVQQATAKGQDYQARMREIDKQIEMLTLRHDALSKNTAMAAQAAEVAAAKFGDWGLVIDARINQIDVLIQRMVKLRQEMAGALVEQAQVAAGELQGQRDETARSGRPGRQVLQREARKLLGYSGVGGLSSLGGLQYLSGITPDGDLDATTLRSIQSRVRQDVETLKKGKGLANNARLQQLQRVLDSLDAVVANTTSVQGLDRRIGAAQTTVGQATFSSSDQSASINTAAQGMFTNWATLRAQADSIKDPTARLAAQQALKEQMRVEFSGLQDFIKRQTADALKDPQAREGFERLARQNGTSVDVEAGRYVFRDTPNLQRMASMSGQVDISTDPRFAAEHAKRLEAEAETARKAGNMVEYNRLRTEAGDAKRTAELGKAMRGEEYDPELLAGMQSERDAAFAAQTAGARPGGGAGSTRGASRTLSDQAKALQRQIEVAAGNLGPGPEEMLAGQANLKDLIAKWRDVREQQIRAESGDVEQRLADFQTEAQEYTDKILNGNIQAARDLLAKKADEAATNFAADTGNTLRDKGGNLSEAVADVQSKFNDAAQAAIEASDASFSAQGLDPRVAAQAIERRRQITAEYAQKAINATLSVIDEFFKGELERQQRELDAAQLDIDRRRARVGALSNSYGSRNLSDVQRALGARAAEQIDIDESRLGVRKAQYDYDAAGRARDAVKAKLDATTDPVARDQLTDQLAAANTNVEQMANNLERAKLAFEQMSMQAPTFASMTDAIRGSWQVFQDQMKLNQPVFEQIADGMTGVFGTMSTGLNTFVKDVASGTKSVGDAFKDLAVSILQSLLDMAAKIIANQILMWIMSMFLPGGGAGSSLAQKPFSQGGEVKNMAGGGEVPNSSAPFRDSVLINAMPGEIMMRKSAVDMVGRDTLLALNAAGNRRLSAMPTIAQAMPQKQPDTWNIWAVLPQHKPPPGKRDIVAAISEDIQTNGQTKQLIKSVIGGA